MGAARRAVWAAAAVAIAGVLSVAITSPAMPVDARIDVRPATEIEAIGTEAVTVAATAERLDPPARRPETLVVVGDSISFMAGYTFNTGSVTLADTLLAAGWAAVHIDAKPSRSMWYPADTSFSGVHTVQRLRAEGHDPTVWMVQLGTNDVWFIERCRCADMTAFARDRIAAVLDAVGAGVPVYWVNVRRWSNAAALAAVNTALAQLRAEGRIVDVVDWFGLSAGRRQSWFIDSAHLSHAGYAAWLGEVARVVRPVG